MSMTKKIIIYQLLPRLFGNDFPRCRHDGTRDENGCGHLSDITPRALRAIKSLGITHVWYTGLIEHATKTDYSAYGIRPDHPSVVKGRAGSPYAIKDYYDIDPDLADNPTSRIEEFRALVERTHHQGLKVVMDFVPNHVARQYHSDAMPDGVSDLGQDDDVQCAFRPDNNFYYIPGHSLQLPFATPVKGMAPYNEMPAKATGNDNFTDCPSVNDWYETVKLNYGIDYLNGRQAHFDPIPSTWHKMLNILLYWASFGIDAFRCDMAEMVPVAFWYWAIDNVKAKYPNLLFIAEVYDPHQYRTYINEGHFDYLYDKVGLYDTLRAVIRYEAPATAITSCWQSTNDIRQHMLAFLENHDEQRLASSFFANDAIKGLPALVIAATMGTNPFMLYFGQELGEPGMDDEGFSGCDGRTTIFDYWSIDTIRRWRDEGKFSSVRLNKDERILQHFYARLLTLTNEDEALRSGQFFDLQYANPRSDHYDDSRQYAYLRCSRSELIVVVANFSPDRVTVGVNIPTHAFDFLHLMPSDAVHFNDLLNDRTATLPLRPEVPMTIELPTWGAVMLKCDRRAQTSKSASKR
jgi:glycosidase